MKVSTLLICKERFNNEIIKRGRLKRHLLHMARNVKVWAVIGHFFLVSLFVSAAASPASAGYNAKDALGTVALGTAFGAVIGLSSMSFYEAPTKHFRNVLLGGGAGMLAGIGAAAFFISSSSSDNEIDPEEFVIPSEKKTEVKDGEKEKAPANNTGAENKLPNGSSPNGKSPKNSNDRLQLAKVFRRPATQLLTSILGSRVQQFLAKNQKDIPGEFPKGWAVACTVLELRF